MARIESIALSLLMMVVIFFNSLGDSKEIFNDYLKRPKMPHVSYFHGQIRKWLNTLKVEAESSPEMVLQQLKEASLLAKLDSFKRENYDKLISLADGGSECLKDVVDLIISIYAQLDLLHQKPLEQFLDHFVRQKFHHCSMTLNNLIEQQEPHGNELVIDKFIKLRLQLAQDSNDFEVYTAIRGSNRKFQLSYDQCAELLDQFGNTLNIMNLAKAVGLRPDYGGRLLKLNEYNRFCPSQLIRGDY